METNSGLDAAANIDDEDTSIVTGLDLDEHQTGRIAASIAHVPPASVIEDITTSILDKEISRNAARSSQFSLLTEGGLVGGSSSKPEVDKVASLEAQVTKLTELVHSLVADDCEEKDDSASSTPSLHVKAPRQIFSRWSK
jgi:hypothetical protein